MDGSSGGGRNSGCYRVVDTLGGCSILRLRSSNVLYGLLASNRDLAATTSLALINMPSAGYCLRSRDESQICVGHGATTQTRIALA
jgi:hypothetical protein